MKLVSTTVGTQCPESEAHNIERLRAAQEAVAKAAALGADLMVLPGGFFTALSQRTRETIAEDMVSEARQKHIAIVFGVDQQVKNQKEDWKILRRGLLLPYYGYGWSPEQDFMQCWQQRSSTRGNQWYVSDKCCEEPRLLRVKGEEVGVLMCGEIFNQRIRNALLSYSLRPKVIIDVAHVGWRFRVWQGMKALAKRGLPSVCSVHAQSKYAVKYCYVSGGSSCSSRECDAYTFGPLRIEMKLWTF